MSARTGSLIERVRAARSDIDAYRIAIEIEREASPVELDQVFRETRGLISVPSLIERLRSTHRLSLRADAVPEPYECVFSSPTVCHYRATGTGLRRAPTMLLAFCGNAQLLFGPVARVLQRFPAAAHEVLVLRDPSKSGFSAGMPGLGVSFEAAMSVLRERFLADGMEVITLGCSGGGGPALVAARLLSAAAGVSFAGRLPTSSGKYGETAGALAMEQALQHPSRPDQRLFAVYGELNERDVEKSTLLAQRCGGSTVVVPGFAGHNVLHELHVRGELASVLRETGLIPAGTTHAVAS